MVPRHVRYPTAPDPDGQSRHRRPVASRSITGKSPGLPRQVADALDYAHRQRVVHRDIKPSNLLLDARGNVWVTDFGLAKFVEGDDLSQSHDLVGTLRFMAPERFRGVTDRRADIYAVGATLYEMLALRPAFAERDQIRLIDQITHQPPVPLRQHDRRIPRDLETIVLKALAKDPKDRFATAGELRDELRRFLEGRPIRSRPVGPAERFWRWCKRNPALAAANITAAVLTTLLAIGSTIAAWTYRDQLHKLDIEQEKTQANLNRALKAERTATERLGETQKAEHRARLALGQSLVSEGAALQRTGLIGQRFDSLDRLAQAAKVLGADPEGRKRLPEIRNHAIAALGLTDLRVCRQHDCGDVFSSASMPPWSGTRSSSVGRGGRAPAGRRPRAGPPAGAGPARFLACLACFSPDGELLVAVYAQGGGQISCGSGTWDAGSCSAACRTGDGWAFHPDGRRLLFGVPEGGIGVWDRGERRVVRRLPLDFTPHYLALDPEGRRLAVNNGYPAAPRVAILELETGRVLADWRSQVGNGALAWSADGQLLAVGGGGNDPRVYVWNVRRGALASVLQEHTAVNAQFAHTGYLLATASWDGTTRLWDAASGEPLVTAPGEFLGFAPDDRRLAFVVGGKIGVWDVATGAECRTLHPGMLGNRAERRDATGVPAADVSPDGRLVATCGGDGVRLWEADTGRELAHLKAGVCETVLFHPDGQSLISSGKWGLYRWPIRPDPERGPDAIRVGPPELLREPAGGLQKATWLPDHRTLALIDNANARVLLVDSSHPHPAWSRATALDSGENHRMTSVAVSPDGRWLAVGGWYEAGVRVWDLRRRRLERILRPKDAVGDMTFFIGFSPDGRWLFQARTPMRALGFTSSGAWGRGSLVFGSTRSATGPPGTAGIHRRRPADGPGDRPRPGAAGRRRHGTRACAADDIAAGDPDTAGLQPRRHEAGCQHQPKDRAGVGPAADPRPACPDGSGLGRSAVSDRPGCEQRRRSAAPAEAGTGRRRSPRAPGAARRRTGRDEPPARRQARRCRGPDPPRLAVHPAEEVARSDRRPGAGLAPPARRHRCPVSAGRSVPGNGQPGRRLAALSRLLERAPDGPRRPIPADSSPWPSPSPIWPRTTSRRSSPPSRIWTRAPTAGRRL